MLPLLTKLAPQSKGFTPKIKTSLESVFLRDLDKWKDDNLSENMSIMRKQKMIAA